MLVVIVNVRVKPDFIEAFRLATMNNARNSIQEPGIARFDVAQEEDDPTRFILIEAYRHQDGQLRHRESPHYAIWRDEVAEMMEEPRTFIRSTGVFPADADW